MATDGETNKRPSVLSASSLNGTNVVNTEGEDIGSIKDLMIDLGYGHVSYAVLQFGGIMGLGEKYFAIPWAALTIDTVHDDIVLDIDKEVLKEAEGFDKDNWPDFANYDWMQETYDYYGYPPYWE